MALVAVGIVSNLPMTGAQVGVGFGGEIVRETFWDTRQLCVARVTKVLEETEVDDRRVRLETVRAFDGAKPPLPITLSVFQLPFFYSAYVGAGPPEYVHVARGRVVSPQLEVGDFLLVIYEPRTRFWGAVKFYQPPEQSPLIELLSEIEAIRSHKHAIAVLKNGLQSKFPSVRQYCIDALASREIEADDEDLARSLIAIRDDEFLSVYFHRIPASKVYAKMQGEVKMRDVHTQWVRNAILESKMADFINLRHLAQEFVRITPDRSDIENVFFPLLLDPKARAEVRFAIMEMIVHPRFCQPHVANDEWTQRVFDRLIELKADPDRRVRDRAMLHASRLADRTTDPKEKNDRTDRVTKAITDAGNDTY